MSRRRRAEDSSLELLLDTITNTFGGILFLAILVALLLRSSSPTAGRDASRVGSVLSEAEQAELEVKLEDLRDRASRLLPVEPVNTTMLDATAHASAQRLAGLRADLAHVLDERARVALRTLESQRSAASTAADAAELSARRTAVSQRHEEAERDHDAATTEAEVLAALLRRLRPSEKADVIEQTAGMPTLHDTEKQQVGIYLRFGKVFHMHSWRNGQRLGPNPTYFVVSPGTPPVARPKPAAGIPVTPETMRVEVGRLVREFPPEDWTVAVIVCGDSFDAFQIVKRALVEARYEYFPLALKPDGAVIDSGGDSRAQ
jgi:Ni/Co efflux regulator RcnB